LKERVPPLPFEPARGRNGGTGGFFMNHISSFFIPGPVLNLIQDRFGIFVLGLKFGFYNPASWMGFFTLRSMIEDEYLDD